MAEGAPLLREYGVYSLIEGSNPSVSAIRFSYDPGLLSAEAQRAKADNPGDLENIMSCVALAKQGPCAISEPKKKPKCPKLFSTSQNRSSAKSAAAIFR